MNNRDSQLNIQTNQLNARTNKPKNIKLATKAEKSLMVFLYKHLVTKKKNPLLHQTFVKKAAQPGGTRNVAIILNEMPNRAPLKLSEEEATQLDKLLKACQYPSETEELKQIANYKKDCKDGQHQTLTVLETTLTEYVHSTDEKKSSLVEDLVKLVPKGFFPSRGVSDVYGKNNNVILIMDFLKEVIQTPEKVSATFTDFDQTGFINSVKEKFKDHPKLLNGIECLEILKEGLNILKSLEQKPQASASNAGTQIASNTAELDRVMQAEKEKPIKESPLTLNIEPSNPDLNHEDIAFLKEEDMNPIIKKLITDEIEKQKKLQEEEKIKSETTQPQPQTTQAKAQNTPAQATPNNPAPVLKEHYQVLYFYRQHIFANQKTLLANPDNRLDKIAKAIDGFFSWIAGKEVKSATRTLENSFFKPKSEHGKKLVDHAAQMNFSIKPK